MGIFGWSLPPGCGSLPGEESEAYEEKIDGVFYAWTEDDAVFKQDPQHPDAREDGYVYIGQITWPDDMPSEVDSAVLLREFVRQHEGSLPMRTLEAFRRGDGAHRGLSDWYPENEAALKAALDAHQPFDTGWYGSKHEIASARIWSADGDSINIEVSVSDDFDTNGTGRRRIKEWSIDEVASSVDEAWDSADEDRKDNEPYIGFSIHDSTGAWVETYILAVGEYDTPPGDNYHWWGWQHDEVHDVGIPHPDIPEDTVTAFEKFAYGGGDELCVNGWTIRRWK
jgi:hypothetical protein